MGEDAGRWCAAAGGEERRKGKGGSRAERSGARRIGVDFVLLGKRRMRSEWSEASGLLDVLIVALPHN